MKVVAYIVVSFLILSAHVINVGGQDLRDSPLDGLSVSLKLEESSASMLMMELTVENIAGEEIYVSINPRDINGKPGWYIDAGDANGSVMFVSSQVYPPPSSFVYSDETSVELKRLGPSETVAIPVRLNSPFKETAPPFAESIMTKKKVFELRKVKRIVVAVGYFSADGVRNMTNRRLKGTYPVRLMDGRETTLLRLQRLAVAELALH